jgi:hypothetical protein
MVNNNCTITGAEEFLAGGCSFKGLSRDMDLVFDAS